MNVLHEIINHQVEYLLARSWFQGEVSVRPSEGGDLHLADHMALIVLGQNQASVSLRVFVAADELRKFTGLRFPSLPGALIDQHAVGWLKEFANTTAGRLKHLFNQFGLSFEHSLPFYLPGYLQIFFNADSEPCHEFVFNGVTLYITVSLAVSGTSPFASLSAIGRDDIFRINDTIAASQSSFDM